MTLKSTAVACDFKEVNVYVCVHACVHVRLPMCAHECACGGQRAIPGIVPSSCLPCFMGQDFLLGPGACQVGRLG